MRAKAKVMVLCSSIAALTLGASMSSMAAQSGWTRDGEGWCYLDSNGDMAVDQWIDDTYYVDINGSMVQNLWIHMDPGVESAPNSDGGWYYLDGNGKAATDGWKTINGRRYYFDTDGTMKYGWFTDNEDTYYLGDESQGWAETGWVCLDYDPDNPPEDGDVTYVETSGSESAKWFYFQPNGKAVKAVNDTYTSKTINGRKYYFDENGMMLTGWVSLATGSDSSSDPTGISTFKYFGDDNDGAMSKGWKYLTDTPEDSGDSANLTVATSSDSYGNSDGSWYYFDSNGTPKYLSADAANMSEAVSRINGQSYFFDEYGRMQYGLIGVDFGDGQVQSAYFGNNESDGKMKTGKVTNVVEDSGDRSTFYFETSGENKGAGYTGEKSGYLYSGGKLVKADQGTTTQVYAVDGQIYLVNESGKIQTSNKVYKSDGDYRYEYDNGTIYYVNSDKQREGEVTSADAALPDISCKKEYSL